MKKHQEFDINYHQDEDGVFTTQVRPSRLRGLGPNAATGLSGHRGYHRKLDGSAREKVAVTTLRKSKFGRLNLYRRRVRV